MSNTMNTLQEAFDAIENMDSTMEESAPTKRSTVYNLEAFKPTPEEDLPALLRAVATNEGKLKIPYDIDTRVDLLCKHIMQTKNKTHKLQTQMDRLLNHVDTISRATKRADANFRQIKSVISGDALDRAKKDSDHIHKAYATSFLKTTVLTEASLAYSSRREVSKHQHFKFLVAIIHAFDFTDNWWIARDQFTLHQWINAFLESMKPEPKTR